MTKNVQAGSHIITDELSTYGFLETDYNREIVNHAMEYVNGHIHTNDIENFWSLLKRSLGGTYISVEPFHLDAYVAEQVFRYNNRKDADDFTRFASCIQGIQGNGVFQPNVACALAFASDPVNLFPGCQIRFLRFDGEFEKSGSDYNAVKTIPVEGALPRLLEETANILTSQLRDFTRLGDDGVFYTAPEYPNAAWYEALVNALVHRSYGMKNMNIFVKMFDDKLVIESPGGFPPLVTPENIYSMHHPRNPTLMRAMFYMGLVKEHAEGTKRMRDSMAGMSLPLPMFEEVQSGMGGAMVCVTLRNKISQRKVWIDSDVSTILGEALAKNLNSEEKRILNFVAENHKISVSQCLKLTPSLSKWQSAKKLLMKLVSKGLLSYIQDGKTRSNKSHFTLPEAFRDAQNKPKSVK